MTLAAADPPPPSVMDPTEPDPPRKLQFFFFVLTSEGGRRHSVVTGMQDFHDGLFGPDLMSENDEGDNADQLGKSLFQLAREGDIESIQAVLSR